MHFIQSHAEMSLYPSSQQFKLDRVLFLAPHFTYLQNEDSNPICRTILRMRRHEICIAPSQSAEHVKVILNMWAVPWPVWLSFSEHPPITKRLWVQFLVQAPAWVAGQIPSPAMYNPWSRTYNPWSGHVGEATNQYFSHPVSLSLKAMKKMSLGKD